MMLIRDLPGAADRLLDVPLMRQGYNCGCGLASIGMALNFAGADLSIHDLEANPLVLPRMLREDGIGPGRLGRIALSMGGRVTIVDPCARDVGRRFVDAGGRWRRKVPTVDDILAALARGVPAVACIPDKHLAFGDQRAGSHWIVVRGIQDSELAIHDPAPWRKAVRCKPGYWRTWRCSLLIIDGWNGRSL